MKTVITIFSLCFTLIAICQSEDKIQGNVKLITETKAEIFTTWNGKDTLYPSNYKHEFYYAPKNNLLTAKTELYKGKLSQKTVYAYKNNKLDSIFNYGPNNVVNFSTIYTYNKNGFLKLKRKVYGHSITDMNYETYYFYNDKNELIETKAFIEINGSRVVGQLFAYDEELGFEYSPDRLVVSKITTNTKGQIVRVDGESIFETYTYDKYGNDGMILKNKGLFLCATAISFIHLITKKTLYFSVPTPHKFVKRLENEEKIFLNYIK